MQISIPAFLSHLLLIGSARAQVRVNVPNCTEPGLAWSFNSLQQSPCYIWASLEAVCFGRFAVSALLPGRTYTGPNVTTADGDLCNCNTVVYALMSACAACQQGGWITYSSWLTNCSDHNQTAGVFPKPVPGGIRVPHWAYLTSFIGGSDSWNLTAAEVAGDDPETTGVPTIASTSQPTLSPTASLSGSSSTFSPTTSGSSSILSPTISRSDSSSISTLHTSSNRGEMEGAVIGGIVGTALISGVVAWFVIRRRRARYAPSITDTGGEIEQPVHHPLTIESPRLYDPSDPTTYPRIEDLRLSNKHLSATSSLQPGHVRYGPYGGLPEV